MVDSSQTASGSGLENTAEQGTPERRRRRRRGKTSSERGRLFRARQRQAAAEVEQSVVLLQQEVNEKIFLRDVWQAKYLRSRHTAYGSLVQLIREYFSKFHFGLRRLTSRDGLSPSEFDHIAGQEEFVRRIMDEGVTSGQGLVGPEASLEQWRRHTAGYLRYKVELIGEPEVVGPEEEPVVIARMNIDARIGPDTFSMFFPSDPCTEPQDLAILRTAMIGQEIRFFCMAHYHFSPESRVVREQVAIDYVDGFLRAGVGIDQVARLMERCIISSESTVPDPGAGGSKNLMTERNRREQVEQALSKTKSSLVTVTTELMPQVEELRKAVKLMQAEKHHQLDLDEASQDVLEMLQNQVREIEAREANFENMLEERLEALLERMREDFRAEKYEMQVLVSRVQDAQGDLAADVRVLHHEFTALQEFLLKRMDGVDDAVESVRGEVGRNKEQWSSAHQTALARVAGVDEKLFGLDKELLKLKLAFPSAVSAQMAPKFMEGLTAVGKAPIVASPGLVGNVAIAQKLQEISSELDAVKTELAAYRAADRQQFDAVTNRVREAGKIHQTLKKEVEQRFQETQLALDQMVTRVPSELSRRLGQAQEQWKEDIRILTMTVQQFKHADSTGRYKSVSDEDGDKVYDAKTVRSMDTELQRHVEQLKEIHNQVETMRCELDTNSECHQTTVTALGSAVARLEQDVLGLYDWTSNKLGIMQEEITFNSTTLQYFQRHAKILPK
ncbi:hypothetical protein Poli38472_014409 [Pythium oligandrum]|uniref:Uncharacterized protein n=1 Tax=Pythium oligandrum TaxID=41045 RepID=A0A8K1C7F0_PYTOL|nr:hypothetical protein Poli38472_014409 [Pythium oligandrum]|eukprot:TMW57806.1 hypothetical protein Poli38472_014409 [Pythium oligandrum]